jgi:SNF2 family DNA or RNA helicase
MQGGYESLILADVGTGKTIMTLTTLNQWFTCKAIKRVIVFAPKLVCTDVWAQEAQLWAHLNNGIMHIGCAAGLSEKKRIAMINDRSFNVVLLNYENMPWLMETYRIPPFDVAVFDEIDKMKDRTTNRFKGRKWKDKETKEKRWYDGMRKYRKHFKTHIGLTGTPTSNHLTDLWAQMFIIDGGKSLGKSYDKFIRKYFYPADYMQHDWRPLPGAEKQIYEAISDFTFRIERDEEIPPIVNLPPRYVDMPNDILKMYKKYEREYIMQMENGDFVESPHAAAAYGKLRQIANGFVYANKKPGDKEPPKTYKFHTFKFNHLDSLISELQGQQLLIVYHFKEQLAELQRRYKDLEYLGGGVNLTQAREIMARWNDGELNKLAIHPMSAGHGLNLQKSGAHHICMLTQPESAGLAEQVIGRLRRTGNEAKSVFIHTILTANTIDIDQNYCLQGKIKTQMDFLDAMKKRCNQ